MTQQVTEIVPRSGWSGLQLREFWRFRELLGFLTWRDLKLRYRQTVFGALWAVMQPLLTMVVFSLFFGRLAQMPSDGVPYPLFSFAGLVPWTLFTYGLNQSAQSLVGNSQLLTKVWFPRLILPVSSVLSGVVDFLLALLVLFAMMLAYGFGPSWRLLAIIPLTLLAVASSLAVGIWLSALAVRYRDVRFTLPFLTQLWLFATPIAYSASAVEGWRQLLWALNPMATVVVGFRWALLGVDAKVGPLVGVSVGVVIVSLSIGLAYFRRIEATFADVV